jgi:hypothetical protein
MSFTNANIPVDIKHLSSHSVIRIDMDKFFGTGIDHTAKSGTGLSFSKVVFTPIELEEFISFILDGYDDEMKPKSTHMVDHYRASLLLKTNGNRFYSQLGTELIMMRNRVMGYILENVGHHDHLEFRRVGNNYLIDVISTRH